MVLALHLKQLHACIHAGAHPSTHTHTHTQPWLQVPAMAEGRSGGHRAPPSQQVES